MKKLIVVFLCVLGLVQVSKGQELLASVSVDARQVQSDKQVFDDMQQNISQYLNYQQWGSDQFETFERIRCNLQIIVTGRPTANRFDCNLNVVVYRPVLNSTYETVTLKLADNDFSFEYVPFQQMQYLDNTYGDELTAVLNFYAFIILGYDYDTFSPNGGNPYYEKAREIVNLAGAASQYRGWKSSESQDNRYWLTENLTNSRYSSFHEIMYTYHRKGLDQMENNTAQGRRAILEGLRELQNLNRQNPLLVLRRYFLEAKNDELVGIFSKAFVNDKKEFITIMTDLNPAKIGDYNKVMDTE